GKSRGFRHREHRRARVAPRASRPRGRCAAGRLDEAWMTDRVLITGFPKLLARRMALRLHAGGAHVTLLVDEAHAPAARDFAQGAMEVLVGDASAMHLGLSTSEYRELTSTVTDVLHAAEETTLSVPRDQMKRLNVSGTQG